MIHVTRNRALRKDFRVNITDHGTATFTGFLYRADEPSKRTLQILLHGNTYDHRYWNAGAINGVDYSYVDYMNGLGYDVLAMDLPGCGASSPIPGDAVDLESVGRALTEVVDAMAGSEVGSPVSTDRIVFVGHSLGAVVAVYTQAKWSPASALVLTGLGYHPDRGPSPFGADVREEAMRCPDASLRVSDRRRVFYHAPASDPDVIDFDNRRLRTSMPRRLWMETTEARNDPKLSGVSEVACPVLIQLGEHDLIMPGHLAVMEREFWPKSSDVQVDVVPDTGHAFNLHHNHVVGWRAIYRYLQRLE